MVAIDYRAYPCAVQLGFYRNAWLLMRDHCETKGKPRSGERGYSLD